MGLQIKKEISIMKSVAHLNVVAIREVFATSTKIFIVLELVDGGELFEYLLDRKRLPESEARHFLLQLTEGLSYCHGKGIFHRDLKPENLLLDLQGNLKISDFGLSTLYVGSADADGVVQDQDRMELLHTTCGTPNYVAPEVLENRGYDGRQADVWSVGIILFVLVAGYLPFEEDTMPGLFDKIKRAEFAMPDCCDGNANPTSPSRRNPYARARSSSIQRDSVQFSRELITLLQNILVADPRQRWSLQQVRDCAWMQGQSVAPAYVNNRARAACPGRKSLENNSLERSEKNKNDEPNENVDPNRQQRRHEGPVQCNGSNPLHERETACVESPPLPPLMKDLSQSAPLAEQVEVSPPLIADKSTVVLENVKVSTTDLFNEVQAVVIVSDIDVSDTSDVDKKSLEHTACCTIS